MSGLVASKGSASGMSQSVASQSGSSMSISGGKVSGPVGTGVGLSPFVVIPDGEFLLHWLPNCLHVWVLTMRKRCSSCVA